MNKLKKHKVLYSGDRIRCNEKGVSFGQLHAMTQTYIGAVRQLKDVPTLNFNHDKFNSSVSFKLFDLKLTVIELFEIYNYSAVKQGMKPYTKLYYDPKNADTFSPKQVSGDLINKK